MTRPRVRISIRRMMVGVAIMATVLGVVAWWGRMETRRRDYEQFESFCAMMERTYRGETNSGDRDRFRYWSGMQRKYELAARNPWFPVATDPPAPE